jgi:hypothetical protein
MQVAPRSFTSSVSCSLASVLTGFSDLYWSDPNEVELRFAVQRHSAALYSPRGRVLQGWMDSQ